MKIIWILKDSGRERDEDVREMGVDKEIREIKRGDIERGRGGG